MTSLNFVKKRVTKSPFCAEFQFFCCGRCCYCFLCGISILLLWLLLLLLFVLNFNSFAVVVAVIAFCAEFQFFCCGCCCYCFLCGISILLLWLLLLLLFVRNCNSFAVVVAVIAFCVEFQFFCCGCCCYCLCWHASIAKFNVWKIPKISKISNCVPRSLVYQTNFGEVRSRSNKEHISRDEKLDKYHKWRQSKKLFFR